MYGFSKLQTFVEGQLNPEQHNFKCKWIIRALAAKQSIGTRIVALCASVHQVVLTVVFLDSKYTKKEHAHTFTNSEMNVRPA